MLRAFAPRAEGNPCCRFFRLQVPERAYHHRPADGQRGAHRTLPLKSGEPGCRPVQFAHTKRQFANCQLPKVTSAGGASRQPCAVKMTRSSVVTSGSPSNQTDDTRKVRQVCQTCAGKSPAKETAWGVRHLRVQLRSSCGWVVATDTKVHPPVSLVISVRPRSVIEGGFRLRSRTACDFCSQRVSSRADKMQEVAVIN